MELKIRMKVKIRTAAGSCSHSLTATSWEVLWAVRESSVLSTHDLHTVTGDTSPAPDWITSSSPLINSSCCLQFKALLRLWGFRLGTTWHFWVSAWESCRLGLRPAVLPDICVIAQQPHLNNSEQLGLTGLHCWFFHGWTAMLIPDMLICSSGISMWYSEAEMSRGPWGQTWRQVAWMSKKGHALHRWETHLVNKNPNPIHMSLWALLGCQDGTL